MNPLLGVVFHWLGGLASGSFYVPYKGVRKWSWETYWLVGGFFSWIIAPWFFAYLNTTDVLTVLGETPGKVRFYTYIFGLLWGFGGLTFGLTMRYLGMSLGMAVALGYCTVFGTLIPPIFRGEFAAKLIDPLSGRVVLAGMVVCVAGIIVTALAGRTKEGEMTQEDKQNTVKEFDFKKGILVATFSGIMSACFAFGLSAGDFIRETTLKVDFVNSAKAAGKTVTRTYEPAEKDVQELVDSLKAAKVFGKGDAETLPGVLAILEKPRATRAKLDDLAKEKESAEKTDREAKLSKELPASVEQAAVVMSTLAANPRPLAARVVSYANRYGTVPAVSGSIIKGLSTLSEKETALAVGESGADLAAIHAKHSLWTGLPVLIVVLLGGFTTNFIWCVLLNIRNKTGYQYISSHVREEHAHHGGSGGGEHGPAEKAAIASGAVDLKIPVLGNYLFSALAGTTWYFQFFFYSMGETQMGQYKFSSWTLHMASIIIFSSIWGLALKEWKGASPKAKRLLFAGLALLVLSTIVIGIGNKIGAAGGS